MIVYIQTFTVPEASTDAFRRRFGAQDNGVARMPGFLGAEVIERSAEGGGSIVKTIARWRSLGELEEARAQAVKAVDIPAFLKAHDATLTSEIFEPYRGLEAGDKDGPDPAP